MSNENTWWALVMGAAASIEDAAGCLRDADAKKQADGAAKHYREAAQKLRAQEVSTARGCNPEEARTNAGAKPNASAGPAAGNLPERHVDDEEGPDDEATCPECEGDGGDKWNDYCLPCPTCGGDGRLW